MVPDGWRLISLEEIVESSSPIRYGVVQIGEDTDGGIPIVPIKYISSIDTSRLHRASKKIEGKYTNSRVKAGDVLISVKGTIGAVGIVPDGFIGNIAREIARIRPSSGYDSAYIALQLKSDNTQKEIENLTVGTTRREFSIHTLRKFSILVPPLTEQKKIAQILSTWDKAITTTERLLANSQQQKKALMQQLLTGKKRLLDKNGVRFGGEWKSVKVSDLLKVRKEKQIPTESVPLYSLTIEDGVTPKSDRYNREFLVKNSDEKKYKVVHPKDIVYNPANLRWGAINFSRIEHRVVVSPIYEVLYIKDETKISLEFVAQKLMTPDQINRFASMVEGTLMERMAVKIEPFLATKMTIPSSMEEQTKIAGVLSDADQEVVILQLRLDALKQEKKALMQQLLTGKRRVKIQGH